MPQTSRRSSQASKACKTKGTESTLLGFVQVTKREYTSKDTKIKPCAPSALRKRLLFNTIHRETVSSPFEMRQGTAVGKKVNGELVALTMDDIEECRFLHLPYIIPENLMSDTAEYNEEIRNYISDSEEEDE